MAAKMAAKTQKVIISCIEASDINVLVGLYHRIHLNLLIGIICIILDTRIQNGCQYGRPYGR